MGRERPRPHCTPGKASPIQTWSSGATRQGDKSGLGQGWPTSRIPVVHSQWLGAAWEESGLSSAQQLRGTLRMVTTGGCHTLHPSQARARSLLPGNGAAPPGCHRPTCTIHSVTGESISAMATPARTASGILNLRVSFENGQRKAK